MTRKKKQETKYEFSVPIFGKLDANVAGKELERIREKYGVLEPSDVVIESIPEDAPLHCVFNWDDTSAAFKWRQEQAKSLIRHIKVVIVNNKVEVAVRAYVNVKPDINKDKRVYMPTMDAIHSDDAYRDLLEQSKDDMNSFIEKYSQIQELNPVKAAMLEAITLL